jgi:hypothetical protein
MSERVPPKVSNSKVKDQRVKVMESKCLARMNTHVKYSTNQSKVINKAKIYDDGRTE